MKSLGESQFIFDRRRYKLWQSQL